MTERQTQDIDVPQQTVIAVPSQADTFLMTIQKAAADSSIDMDKMQRLYDMYKDVKANEAKIAYNTAMAVVQGEIPAIARRHWNDQTKSYFSKIEDILKDAKPVWTSHGFSVTTYPGDGAPEGFVRIIADVSHSGGDTRTYHYDNPIDDKGMAGKVNKTQTHGRASGYTYGSRYLICMIFQIEQAFAGQDNDGNNGEVELISEDQANALYTQVHDNPAIDDVLFLEWLKKQLKVGSIAEISVKALPTVERAIKDTISNYNKKVNKA